MEQDRETSRPTRVALDGVASRRAAIPLAHGGVLTTAECTRNLGNRESDVKGDYLSGRFSRECRSGEDGERKAGKGGGGNEEAAGEHVERRGIVLDLVAEERSDGSTEDAAGSSAGGGEGRAEGALVSKESGDGDPVPALEGTGVEHVVEVDLEKAGGSVEPRGRWQRWLRRHTES